MIGHKNYLLKSAMAGKDLTISKLAQMIGTNRVTLGKKISGKIAFDTEDIGKIREVMDLSHEDAARIFLGCGL
jgi:cyanate lyase